MNGYVLSGNATISFGCDALFSALFIMQQVFDY